MSAPAVPYGTCHCGCGEPTPIAKQNHARSGHVKGQPVRFILGHQARKKTPEYVEEDRGYSTPCWIWQRALDDDGYGRRPRRYGRSRFAHRSYFEEFKGAVPDGMQLDHLCRVRACVNPDHLEAVTNVENARRGAATKLTLDQVREIRASTDRGMDLAARFGVSQPTISDIRHGRSWAGV